MEVDAQSVSVVIPARNAERTLPSCLGALAELRRRDKVLEVIVVDDASTDTTAAIASMQGAEVLRSARRGPGAARNAGWRAARGRLIWFVDADCVPRPEALDLLLETLSTTDAAAAGGSYENLSHGALLPWLIQEEIAARHELMPVEPWLLGTFNVVYQRETLAQVGGFDEALLKAQDAELSYRMRSLGHRLAFDKRSVVGHFHETSWWGYLRTQSRQGYWRAHLYDRFPGRAKGDGYSNRLDHAQPPLTLLGVVCLLIAPWWTPVLAVAGVSTAASIGCALPMAWRIAQRTRSVRAAAYPGFSVLRALARAVGFGVGVLTTRTARKT